MTGLAQLPGADLPAVDAPGRRRRPRASRREEITAGNRRVLGPVFIPAPPRYPRGPDGQGWNRLRIESIWGDECALKPRSPAKLWETRNRPAAYGGYGPCPAHGACGTCRVAGAPPRRLRARGGRVLVWIDPGDWGVLRLSAAAGSEPEHPGEVWTWTQLARLGGWEPGRHGRGRDGEWFWLDRTGEDQPPGAAPAGGHGP